MIRLPRETLHPVQRFAAAIVTMSIITASIIIFGLMLAFSPSTTDQHVACSHQLLRDSVHIYRNDFGIPHIIARTDEDAFLALGYVHASDRLWQMDFFRRIAAGRLAEILGPHFVVTDAFFRTLGLEYTAERVLWPALSPESKQVLQAYTRGVNLYIEHHKKQLPFEFSVLGYLPTPWREIDCLAIGRLMAFDLSMSFWTDLALGEIADRYDVSTALRLIPGNEPTTPRVLAIRTKERYRDTAIGFQSLQGQGELEPVLRAVGSLYASVRVQLGIDALGSGSNSWAISISSDPKHLDAILANDPHLQLSLPPRWYQVHISSPSYNVVGLTIPGLPIMLAGRNATIAWGVTNVMLDDCDYFIELTDPTRPNTVLVGEKKVKLSVRLDTIHVRGGSTRVIAIRTCSARPVISDAHLAAEADTALIGFPRMRHGPPLTRRYLLTLRWTGYEPSDEIRSLLHIMRARRWSEFRSALRYWGAPALNFTYADRGGNIGIQPAGVVPLRGEGHPNLPRPGWDTSAAWRGVLRSPFSSVYNPPTRFVLSANNVLADSLGFFVSHLWEPGSRAERIAEVLSLGQTFNERDFQLLQLDLGSPYAQRLNEIIRPVLVQKLNSEDSVERKALEVFQAWNYYLLPSASGAAIYSVFLERLMNITFCAHLQEDYYRRYAFIPSLPLRRIIEILQQPTEWFSSDSTTAVRLRDQAIVRAFKEAVKQLREQFAPHPAQWRWGDLHRLVLQHPFARIPAYRTLLERKLDNIGGDATTIANGLWRIHKPFSLAIGASMRMITRMSDTVVYTILPGGISGNPLSNNFSDQLTLWANGGLLAIPISPYPQPDWRLATLLFPR
ncbi:MAG: penicillin acylase family protein [Bacteroidota bacterium]|nr:penicillin acylase family protein [Candidatus Kapabacteria bacterium]MDW8271072.1 penicillin acylase family protein [Bacteroidota bacterium]